jgi:hypothetical protein
MNFKALRRRHYAGRTTTQLTHAGRSRRQLPSVRPVTGADQLVGRWTLAADGRLVLAWGRRASASARHVHISSTAGMNA